MLLLSAVTPNIQQREILIRPRVTVKANAIYTVRKVADPEILRLLVLFKWNYFYNNKNQLSHKWE